MKKNPDILSVCKNCWCTYSIPWRDDEEWLCEKWRREWLCPATHWTHLPLDKAHEEIQGIPKYCPYFMEILVLNQGYPK